MLTVLRHSQRNWTSECRVATGRSAINHLISKLSPHTVLMPAYVPDGVIIPFQRMGVPIKFYKLRDDLRPDLDHLQKIITRGSLVIVIHYFGFLTEIGALREIVSNAKGILFEDCAHAPFATAPQADVALWSLNKFLPVVDGAILRSRRRNIDVNCPEHPSLPPHVMAAYHQHLDLNSHLALADPQQAVDIEHESRLAYEVYYKYISQNLGLHSQSAESKCIVANTDLAGIEEARSYNSLTYYKNIPICYRFRVNSPIAPFAFPIIVRPPLNCEHVFERLMEVGVLPSRMIDKWDHLPKSDDRFENEHIFMDQHLLLPVGEEVTLDHIRKISVCLKEISNGY